MPLKIASRSPACGRQDRSGGNTAATRLRSPAARPQGLSAPLLRAWQGIVACGSPSMLRGGDGARLTHRGTLAGELGHRNRGPARGVPRLLPTCGGVHPNPCSGKTHGRSVPGPYRASLVRGGCWGSNLATRISMITTICHDRVMAACPGRRRQYPSAFRWRRASVTSVTFFRGDESTLRTSTLRIWGPKWPLPG